MAINPILYCHTRKIKKTIKKAIFVWYPKKRPDLKAIHKENDILTDNELIVAKKFLKKSKYGCLYIRNEYPRGFKLLNHI